MRVVPFLLLAAIATAGCFTAGVDIIEQAREDDGVQESVEGEVETPTDATPPVATRPVPTPVRVTPTPTATTPVTTTPVATTPVASTPVPSTPTPAATTPPPAPTPTMPSPTPAAPAPRAAVWPGEESFVRYEVVTTDATGTTQVFADWQYDDDDWEGRCRGDGEDRRYDADDPPHWPPFDTRAPPPVGGSMTAWYLLGCEITSRSATYDGNYTASGPGFATRWDARTGLVLSWSLTEGGRTTTGRLVASG